MNLRVASHLIYEIYPEVLADWMSHQTIEEQSLFLAHYIASLSFEQMDEMSKAFTNYSYTSTRTSNDLEAFAKRAKDAMIVKFGGDYDF